VNFGIPSAKTRVVFGGGEDVSANTAYDRMLDISLFLEQTFSLGNIFKLYFQI